MSGRRTHAEPGLIVVSADAPAPLDRMPAVGFRTRRFDAVGVAIAATLAFLTSGCGPKRPDKDATATDAAASALTQTGEQVYQMYCSVCHMPDGGGVPNFQPALRGSAIVRGDPAKLEAVIRAGSEALRDREPLYAAEMPPFGTLSDDEVKATVAYVRGRFGAAADGKAP